MAFRAAVAGVFLCLGLPSPAWAGVPTASLPLDDAESPSTPTAAPPPSAPEAGTSGTLTPGAVAPAAPASNTATAPYPRATGEQVRPVPVVPAPAAPGASAGQSASLAPGASTAMDGIDATPSSLVASPPSANFGFARVSLQLKEAGSSVQIFPSRTDVDSAPIEAALVRCSANCSFELPHGEYAIRVVTAAGVQSDGELSLRSARWISVGPANRVARDLGFAAGLAGSASTLLGVALLSGAICERCSEGARNLGGAFGLGIGIPMLTVGWSLYYIHRHAVIDEQVLTQTSKATPFGIGIAPSTDGVAVSATIGF